MIAKELRMGIEPIVLGDENDQSMDADDMHDALTMIRNGGADTLAMGIETTVDRRANFSFTNPLYKVQTRFIMRQSENVYVSLC